MLILSGLASLFLLFVAVIVYAFAGPAYSAFIALPAAALLFVTLVGLIAKVRMAERRRQATALQEHEQLEEHLEELRRVVAARRAAEEQHASAQIEDEPPSFLAESAIEPAIEAAEAGPEAFAVAPSTPVGQLLQAAEIALPDTDESGLADTEKPEAPSSHSLTMRAVESLALDVVHSMDAGRLLGEYAVSTGEKVSVDLDAYPTRSADGGEPCVDLSITVVLPRQSMIGMLPVEKGEAALTMVHHVGAIVVSEYEAQIAPKGHKAGTIVISGWLMPASRSGKGPRRCIVSARGPASSWKAGDKNGMEMRWRGGARVEPFVIERESPAPAPDQPLKMTVRQPRQHEVRP